VTVVIKLNTLTISIYQAIYTNIAGADPGGGTHPERAPLPLKLEKI